MSLELLSDVFDVVQDRLGVVAVAVLTAAVIALVPGRGRQSGNGRPSRLGKLPGRAGRSVAD